MTPQREESYTHQVQLLCPVCQANLHLDERTFRCPGGHAFDQAREGYVNLLRLRKQPKTLGDTKAMLTARRVFLDEGFYDPLSDKIVKTVAEQLVPNQHEENVPLILDVGCGEGGYLHRLAEHLCKEQMSISLLGMDLSKEAVRMAAKRNPTGLFFVADVRQPFLLPDGSVDCILNIFSPRNGSEFHRVLTADGLLLIVMPDAPHLQSLRERFDLLAIQADKEEQVCAQMATSGFRLHESKSINFSITLTPDALGNLIQMTPNFWHVSEEQAQMIEAAASPMTTEASFHILSFIK